VQEQLAELLHMPISAVQVTPTEIGGGFGGKLGVYLEPLAALLSRKAGHRPVKMTMTRAEVLAATGPTSGSYIKVKMGATREGKLTAAEATLIYEAGAFPGSPVGAGCGVILAPYKLEHLRIDGYDVVVNRPKAAAYRAPGGTNAAFASESVVDELAQKLGIDPLEFRLRNAVWMATAARRPPLPRIGYTETLDAAASHPHYLAPLTQPHSGRGIAAGFWFNWGGKSSAVGHGQPRRHGQPGRRLDRYRRQPRQRLPCNWPKPWAFPTRTCARRWWAPPAVGYNDVTGGSRTTFGTGWAVYEVGNKDSGRDAPARRRYCGRSLPARSQRRRASSATRQQIDASGTRCGSLTCR
jgi:xanthine dehydrogenase molybdenum-binding subunit